MGVRFLLKTDLDGSPRRVLRQEVRDDGVVVMQAASVPDSSKWVLTNDNEGTGIGGAANWEQISEAEARDLVKTIALDADPE